MGFNLKMFFEELDRIINGEGTIIFKFKQLRKAIQDGRDYARDCGHIQGK